MTEPSALRVGSRDPTLQHVFATALLVSVAYYVGTNIGLIFRIPPSIPSVLWPPNAILTATLLLTPARRWWIYLLAAFPAHLAAQLGVGWPLSLILTLFATNCSEAVVAAFLVRRYSDAPTRFDTLRRVAVFIGCVALVAPFVSSFLAAAVISAMRHAPYWLVWQTRFSSNVLSELTLVPAIVTVVSLRSNWGERTGLRRHVEAALLTLASITIGIAVVALVTLGVPAIPGAPYAPLALFFPLILWAALRFGPGGANLSLLTPLLLTTGLMTDGPTPVTALLRTEGVIVIQILLCIAAVPLMGVAAVFDERRRAGDALADRLRFEELASGLSAKFATLQGAAVDRGIEESLQRVGEHLGADRATITQRVDGSDAIEAIYVWRRLGEPTTPLPMRRADLPWTAERIRSGQLLRFSRLGDLPAEAAVDRETFGRIGITSGLGLPLITGAATVGALTLGYLGREREWPDDLVQRLKFVAGIFSSVLVRRHHEAELEKLRHDLSHFGRVAAMTELAASLAHEVSQPLTAILSNAQAARRMLDRGVGDTTGLREILSDIVADDQRAGEVIRHLRAFIRKDGVDRGPVDVNVIVQNVVSFVRAAAIVRNISVEVDLDPGLPNAIVDRVEIQQVLVNLLMNAFDALSSAGDRRAVVATRKAGPAIQVSVKDSGSGIPVTDLARIFDRFYTTKSSGLGMGLSIARSLIETHGGRLWAENNKDGGATFTFTLPVSDAAPTSPTGGRCGPVA